MSLSSINLRNLYHLILISSAKSLPRLCIVDNDKRIFSGLQNDYLFQQAIARNTNEQHFSEILEVLHKKNWVAVDMGGNIGTHSIDLSKKLSQGSVLTYEPQALTFSILQNNLLLNACDNVKAFRFALSNEDNQVVSMQPYIYDNEFINVGAVGIDSKGFIGDLVITKKLDSFQFTRLDFIKIDIQGSEVRALQGAKATIQRFKPYMFIEIEQQHLLAMNTSAKELIELILSYGYALYRIENDYPCDHICVPIERLLEFDSQIVPQLNLTLSSVIKGTKVTILFEHAKAQNYASIVSS